MNKPTTVLKMIFSASLSIATGFGAPEMPQQLVAGRQGNLIVPESSVVRVEDRGLRAHTNHLILAPEAAQSMPLDTEAEPDGARAAAAFTPHGKSPASLRSVYRLPATGGTGVIALVDAYDDATAEHDLGVFSTQFGLPACTSLNGCFTKVYATGVKPAASCSWSQEADLDIEWAHAIAPGARIVLVEAASNNSNDLAVAVNVASSLVSRNGSFGEVSMSWGFSEFSGETSLDHNFTHPGVVYVAASGDVGGQRTYPAVSPYVIAAGGTTLTFNLAGQFVSESAWSSGGGGPSTYEARPSFQDSIVSHVGSKRGTPDIAFDADPQSGVAVYDSTPCGGASGWLVFGGTSLSSPAVAGILNLAGHFYASSDIELSAIYSKLGSTDFRDVTTGQAGAFSATKGWDFVTGVGSSLGLVGK